MSTFLEKSTQSLNSANLLAKEQFYSSTANRAYYASLQFVLHILIKTGDDKNAIYQECELEKKGTHTVVFKRIKTKLVSLNGYNAQFKWFQKTFPELKNIRTNADYKDDVTTFQTAHDSIEMANSIIDFLNTTFA